MLLSALLHIFAGLKRTRDQKLSSGLMMWSIEFGCHCFIVEEHVLLSAFAAHLRGFEEDSRSEVVFWIEEWSIELNLRLVVWTRETSSLCTTPLQDWESEVVSWFVVAHVHDHTLLPVPLRRY